MIMTIMMIIMMIMIMIIIMMMIGCNHDDDDDEHDLDQGQTTPGKDIGFEEEMEELHLSRFMLYNICSHFPIFVHIF